MTKGRETGLHEVLFVTASGDTASSLQLSHLISVQLQEKSRNTVLPGIQEDNLMGGYNEPRENLVSVCIHAIALRRGYSE